MFEYYFYLNECKGCKKINYTNKDRVCRHCSVILDNRRHEIRINPEFLIIKTRFDVLKSF